MIDGIIWAVIFGLVISPVLGVVIKPLRAMTPTVNLIKGLIWGGALWIISSPLWMPLLIGPIFHLSPLNTFGLPCRGSPFRTCFGPHGVPAPFTDLFLHQHSRVHLG